MKKFLLLTLIFSAIISTASYAQAPATDDKAPTPAAKAQAPDQAAMLQQMKEKFKAPMVAKTGITEAQADRVIEINFETRMAAAGLRDLNEADRSAKIAELKAAKEKKISEILTPEQIKAVDDFYKNFGKN
jgi:Spy/CpxP family protein refolding chaperone